MSEHAKENAKAWLYEIKVITKQIEETRDGDELDELNERVQEMPLSVEVRDGWRAPGQFIEDNAVEYQILLSTGGPALRISGGLDKYNRPSSATLQWQDWGTPWTEFVCEGNDDYDALMAFVGSFYYED